MFYNVSRVLTFVNGRMQVEMAAQTDNGCIGPGGNAYELKLMDSHRTEFVYRRGSRKYIVDRFEVGDEDHDPTDEEILQSVKDVVKAMLDYEVDEERKEILSFGTVDEIEIAILRELRNFLGFVDPVKAE